MTLGFETENTNLQVILKAIHLPICMAALRSSEQCGNQFKDMAVP